MPLAWYSLGAGPAPWADATSFSSSLSVTESSTRSATNNDLTFGGGYSSLTAWDTRLFTTADSGESYSKDRDSITHRRFLQQSNYSYVVSYDAGDYYYTKAYTSGSTFESGATSTGGVFNSSTSRTDYSSYSWQAHRVLANGGSGFTETASYSSSQSYGETLMGTFIYQEVGITEEWSYSVHGTATDQITTVTFDTAGHSSSFTTVQSGETISSDSSSYTTTGTGTRAAGTSTVGTLISVGTTSALYRYVSTTTELESMVTGSTESTTTRSNSTTTITGTIATTTESTATYTAPTASYDSTTGTTYISESTTYVVGASYRALVLSAYPSEILRAITATATGAVDLDSILGPTFTGSTFDSALFSGSQGVPFSESTATRTATRAATTYSTVTATVSTGTSVTITEQSFRGHIPPLSSQTVTRRLSGRTSTTRTYQQAGTSASTYTATGARTSADWQLTTCNSFVPETITALLSSGGTSSIAVQFPYVASAWTSFIAWSGSAGQTVSTYRSPAFGLYNSGAGVAAVTRMERAYGFQSPAAMGSTGGHGHSLSAAHSFYIGAANLGTASPQSLRIPVIPMALSYGTAGDRRYSQPFTTKTVDSFYSFRLGPAAVWSVTTARTISTTVSATTTAASSATTSTTVSASLYTDRTAFTQSVSAVTNADQFNSATPSAVYAIGRTVAGGAHAYVGGDQALVLSAGHGFRYTLRDSSSHTTTKTILSVPYTALPLGSQIAGVETFDAGLGSPAVTVGLPNYSTFDYSSP